MAAPQPTRVFVSDIKSKLLRPALTSHYICEFSPPLDKMGEFLQKREAAKWIGADYKKRDNQELIQLSCCDASLPGASLMTNEINDDHTGVTERHAYRRQYDDRSDFTFYVDNNYKIINFFESWIAYVVGEDLQKDVVKRDYFYRSNFPSDYQTDNLYITKFERDHSKGTNGIEYQFIGAYPINISSMPVSYELSQVLKCTVSFTYIRYVISNRTIKAEPAPAPTNQALQGVPRQYITTPEGDIISPPFNVG